MADVKIDPSLIPDHEYDQACEVLFASISMALANPVLRAEFEAWKQTEAQKGVTA